MSAAVRERPLAVIVTGPTASGKTALAVGLARALHTEVVCADSRQVYRGIPIATAAPTAAERAMAPHHLAGVLQLDEPYSAARFAADARRCLDAVFGRCGGVAVVCGGSMLYIDALLGKLDDLPDVEPAVRARVAALLAAGGREAVAALLREVDPAYLGSCADPRNTKRLVHAAEVSLQCGRPYSSLLTAGAAATELPFSVLKLAIARERADLFDRINRRVEAMVGQGLEEEARAVAHLRHLNSLNTVGLKEMFAMIDGHMQRGEAIARIQKNTRVYAKKQLTWLRRDSSVVWLDPDTALTDALDTINALL